LNLIKKIRRKWDRLILDQGLLRKMFFVIFVICMFLFFFEYGVKIKLTEQKSKA